MDIHTVDIAIVGAGGAGLRAAIAVAESHPALAVALISKVYPMRSHTVAAEGGAAAVTLGHDSLDDHFRDTVAGGDWLCEQDVVEYFVGHAHEELVQLEHWGCPWSRRPDGRANVRAFGGMKTERTWFAADRTGFHMLHTLFQTSTKYPSIRRFDEHFCVDLIVAGGRVQGVLVIEIATGDFRVIQARAVIIATGGAGRVFRENTNGGIVTGDGMALAYRHGVPLRDMEFVQYHPTCMPGTGLLFTEACRGEGGFLLNKEGYRYLQDYGLGPAEPRPRNKAMELGPRDRLSQAYWHEKRKGRTISDAARGGGAPRPAPPGGSQDRERLPLICELARALRGVIRRRADPGAAGRALHHGRHRHRWPHRDPLPGLYAAGECSSVGIHGANRLGSNSLAETAGVRQGRRRRGRRLCQARTDADAGRLAARRGERRRGTASWRPRRAAASARRACATRWRSMESGCGIYRTRRTCRPPATSSPSCASATSGSGSTTAPASATPNGCRRSSSAACSKSPRPWRIRRWSARNRAARTSGSTATRRATSASSSSTRWPITAARRRRASTTAPVKITTSPPGKRGYGAPAKGSRSKAAMAHG